MTHLGRRRLHRYAVRVPRQDVLVAAVAGGRQSFALGLTGCVRLTYPTSPCDVLAHVPVLRPTLDVPNEIAIISREIHCLTAWTCHRETSRQRLQTRSAHGLVVQAPDQFRSGVCQMDTPLALTDSTPSLWGFIVARDLIDVARVRAGVMSAGSGYLCSGG
jgi:hypothetical protein